MFSYATHAYASPAKACHPTLSRARGRYVDPTKSTAMRLSDHPQILLTIWRRKPHTERVDDEGPLIWLRKMRQHVQSHGLAISQVAVPKQINSLWLERRGQIHGFDQLAIFTRRQNRLRRPLGQTLFIDRCRRHQRRLALRVEHRISLIAHNNDVETLPRRQALHGFHEFRH